MQSSQLGHDTNDGAVSHEYSVEKKTFGSRKDVYSVHVTLYTDGDVKVDIEDVIDKQLWTITKKPKEILELTKLGGVEMTPKVFEGLLCEGMRGNSERVNVDLSTGTDSSLSIHLKWKIPMMEGESLEKEFVLELKNAARSDADRIARMLQDVELNRKPIVADNRVDKVLERFEESKKTLMVYIQGELEHVTETLSNFGKEIGSIKSSETISTVETALEDVRRDVVRIRGRVGEVVDDFDRRIGELDTRQIGDKAHMVGAIATTQQQLQTVIDGNGARDGNIIALRGGLDELKAKLETVEKNLGVLSVRFGAREIRVMNCGHVNIRNVTVYNDKTERPYDMTTFKFNVDKKFKETILLITANICVVGVNCGHLVQIWKYGDDKVKTTIAYGQTENYHDKGANVPRSIPCMCVIEGHDVTGVQELSLNWRFSHVYPFMKVNPATTQGQSEVIQQPTSVVKVEEIMP